MYQEGIGLILLLLRQSNQLVVTRFLGREWCMQSTCDSVEDVDLVRGYYPVMDDTPRGLGSLRIFLQSGEFVPTKAWVEGFLLKPTRAVNSNLGDVIDPIVDALGVLRINVNRSFVLHCMELEQRMRKESWVDTAISFRS